MGGLTSDAATNGGTASPNRSATSLQPRTRSALTAGYRVTPSSPHSQHRSPVEPARSSCRRGSQRDPWYKEAGASELRR